MKPPDTYCNPLPIPDMPRGKDDWFRFEGEMFSHEQKPEGADATVYASISDPTVMYYDNKWYLYPSYGMAWVSEDFCRWKHFRTEPYCPKYSPTVIPYKNGFLLTSWLCPLYYAASPLGPFEKLGDFIEPNGEHTRFYDPALFRDEDGRIYLYAFDAEGVCGTDSYVTKIIGLELDKDNPRRIITPKTELFRMRPQEHWWERQGFFHCNHTFGWVEGPHLIKVGRRYYMIYAAPDTRDGSYCMAVYYSDSSPLHGFVCQQKNPLTYHPYGLVSGAGHGCVTQGPDNSLWAFYTVATPRKHQYERRIGMDRVLIDENGEMYCPNGVTDTPQLAPGNEKQGSNGYLNLTAMLKPTASSSLPGREPHFATDQSSLTYWAPSQQNAALTVCLDARFVAGAVRIFWAPTDYEENPNRDFQPVAYRVKGYADGQWLTLVDGSEATEHLNIDYQVFEETGVSQVSLEILGEKCNRTVGVVDFSVFGYR